ncbi:hypothetical protein NGRA_0779 [Nosema granulosis]|uniref:Uncharacterized protein n=1 Tax=Nosema granulosis TaxID=83296 RepID=A0A9P6H0B0_9MICR|nr:hypothetical protein NGRA_0779 [Nosema granulosis]
MIAAKVDWNALTQNIEAVEKIATDFSDFIDQLKVEVDKEAEIELKETKNVLDSYLFNLEVIKEELDLTYLVFGSFTELIDIKLCANALNKMVEILNLVNTSYNKNSFKLWEKHQQIEELYKQIESRYIEYLVDNTTLNN